MTGFGCGGARAVEEVEPAFDVPEAWESSVEEAEPVLDEWCLDFEDRQLVTLIEEVLDKNLDLRIAHARVMEARALVTQARSQFSPFLDLFFDGEGERRLSEASDWEAEYEVGAAVSYEVDLWGRIRSATDVAVGELRAAELDVRALEMILAVETAESYFQLVRSREELALLDQQIETAETFLELTEFRHSQGLEGAMDVVQQRQQIEELREQKVRASRSESLARQSLAALLGEPAANVELPEEAELPRLSVPEVTSLPGDLLARRPDVLASRTRAAAADARVHAAITERLPQLEISTEALARSASLTGLLDHLFGRIAGEALQHLWAGGYWKSRVEEEEAVRERLVLEFSTVLLDAIREVEEALIDLEARQDIIEAQRSQLSSAREALEMAQDQYRAGLMDYLRVLTALQSVQDLELAVLNSRQALLSHSVQLCRAAGGDWVHEDVNMEREDDE